MAKTMYSLFELFANAREKFAAEMTKDIHAIIPY